MAQDPPPFYVSILGLCGTPTKANLQSLNIINHTLKVFGPYESCGQNIFCAVEKVFPGHIFSFYRAREKGPITTSRLREKLASHSLDELAEELSQDSTYQEFFDAEPGEVRPRHVIIVVIRAIRPAVQVPPPAIEEEDDDDMPEEVHFFLKAFKTHRKTALARKSPSVAAKSVNYIEIQSSEDGLLDGRFALEGPATAAPPIELFHPAFAAYKRDTENSALVVPPDFVCDVAALIRKLSAVLKEEPTRDEDCRELLAKILETKLENMSNTNESSPDWMTPIITPIKANSGTPVIVEIKSELGNGESDPSVQVSFSYEQFVCAPERAALLEQSNCPSFLLGLAGPWLVVCGAVMVHRTVVQRLGAYEWHACSRIGDDAQVLVLARRLFAVRKAIAALKAHYAALQEGPALNLNRFYPSFDSFVDGDDDEIQFRYLRPLEQDLSCLVFLAKRLDTEEEFVVKFASRYSPDAHKHMAGGGYAPRLLGHQLLGPGYGNWALVAMEYVKGATLSTMYGSGPLPADVRGAIQTALIHLRSENYIMPDLRRPNVMLVNGEEPMNKRIRFIDFDWACKEGDGTRYPFHLSREVRDAAKAKDYDEITRKHEQNLFDKYF